MSSSLITDLLGILDELPGGVHPGFRPAHAKGLMCIGTFNPLSEGPDNDYRLLANELMRLMLAQQLFLFVTAAPVQMPGGEARPVAGTNNEAQRTLRSAAEARKTGRTSKTLRGVLRQTILVSVLESLRQQLATFTLSSVIHEILLWTHAGLSCFAKLLAKLQLAPSDKSMLDLVFPVPSG